MYCESAYKNDKKNEDLEFERKQATFSVSELNLILNDNDLKLINIKNEIKKFIENDKTISKPQEIHFLTREQLFKRGLYQSSKLRDIKKKYGDLGASIYYNSLFEEIPFVINDVVFASAFKSMASEKQMKEIYPKFENYEWLGSYSQTEIGHGSNVQGIETTCTYIKSKDEFELNSPTLTSTKYWIGGLGKLSTHTIVFAQLLIPNEKDGTIKNYGPHPFFVQVRCLKTHLPLKGIIVGDIGPKLGFGAIDNGFLRLDHVRISRDSMLSRFFRVNDRGEYEKPKHPRLIYAGMVGVRSTVIENSFVSLSRAVTIATRYSVIRKQFKSSPNETVERKVLDYSNQMNRIIPYIAQTYSFFFTGKRFALEFTEMMKQIKENQNTTLLAELHSNSSGLKSLMTIDTANGIESCRLSCGGHGYSHFSGIPYLWQTQVHIVSAEGESNLLPQQTTKYLLSILSKISTGEINNTTTLGKSVLYIKDEFESSIESIDQFLQENSITGILHPDSLLQLFKHRSFNLLKNLANKIQESMANGGVEMSQIWSDLNVEINHCSRAHSQLYVIQSFYDEILKLSSSSSSSVSTSIINILIQLLQIYSVFIMNNNLVDFVQDKYLDLNQIEFFKSNLIVLYKLVRPNLVALVDSFDLCNTTLGSSLGRYNGEVYETIYNWSLNQPFNDNPIPLGFNEYVKPLFNNNNSKL